MIKHKIFFIISLLLCLIILYGCKSNSIQDVDKAVMDFFFNYKHNDFRDIDRTFLSEKLSALINQSIEREKREVEKVEKSDYPTDKPFIIEGDIFTSMYEGADSLQILNIEIKSDTAIVNIAFTNSEYHVTWNDCLILVKEKNWKVDNMVFQGEAFSLKNTQDILSEYIHAIN